MKVEGKKGTLQRQECVSEDVDCGPWLRIGTLPGEDALLQLRLSELEDYLLGTTALGFCVWHIADVIKDAASKIQVTRIDLKLPPSVRNISVRLLHSNSIILSKENEFALAGVRYECFFVVVGLSYSLYYCYGFIGRIFMCGPCRMASW